MHHVVEKSGVLALTTGTFFYFYHTRRSRDGRVFALQEEKGDQALAAPGSSFPDKLSENRAKVKARGGKDGSLALELVQVQVAFRHGARTPIFTLPKLQEVEYNPEFVTRDHQASMFPYQSVSCVDGSPQGTSQYQSHLFTRLLRGGASTGALTSLGKEQMYMLGLRLRDSYIDTLGISTFDPEDVRILSSNVRRTIESLQSVLAGFYGKEHLTDYAERHGPVQLYISDQNYNILIPNTRGCGVLKKNNHSAMVHPDFLPGFKEQRLEIEAHIMKSRNNLLKAVSDVQSRIDSVLQGSMAGEVTRNCQRKLNKYRQHYQHDPVLQPLYEARGKAIARVDRFWANVLNRDPVLRDIVTKSDLKMLVYLRSLEVEKFEGTLASGYRIHLVFDRNPYFFNTHLCKEIFTHVNPAAPPSRQTSIKWRPGCMLIPEGVDEKEGHSLPRSDQAAAFSKPPSHPPAPKSFFHWFIEPAFYGSDTVLPSIVGKVWQNPQSLFEQEPKVREPWEEKLHFVYGLDDTRARVTHGLPYPPEVLEFREQIDDNAASILYYSMAGQTPASRAVITRLAGGPLLTEILDQAHKVVSGQKAPKLCLYSSHDSSLTPLMEILSIWNNKWPPFGSDIRLELYHEADGPDFYVRVLYNGKEQKIHGQDEVYIRWEDFCSAVSKYTIRREEMDRICGSDILERIAQGSLKHEKGEVETKQIREKTETPAGM